MLTSNLEIDDRLVNGLVGTVKQIKYKNNEVSVVYVKFNDNHAGRKRGSAIRCESPIT